MEIREIIGIFVIIAVIAVIVFRSLPVFRKNRGGSGNSKQAPVKVDIEKK